MSIFIFAIKLRQCFSHSSLCHFVVVCIACTVVCLLIRAKHGVLDSKSIDYDFDYM